MICGSASGSTNESATDTVALQQHSIADRRDYDVEHDLQVLVTSYAARLRKAFSPDDFEQLFRLEDQPSLFDRPIESIHPRWIRCEGARVPWRSSR
jgi:DNA polymerase, archaea type